MHENKATQESPYSASLRTCSQVCCTVRSSSSSAGSAAVRARARAEAAKARLCYAKEEANLRLQQAKLEVSTEMLKHKKEAAAAIAEAEALEAARLQVPKALEARLSCKSSRWRTVTGMRPYLQTWKMPGRHEEPLCLSLLSFPSQGVTRKPHRQQR